MAAGTRIPGGYHERDAYIEHMRKDEYPVLQDALYLDHAGTTLYSKRLMDRFHNNMTSTLFGNPHSASPSSQAATQRIDVVRNKLLDFFGADPVEYDVIFTANATAAARLVFEAFREHEGGFRFAYHLESHTSLVGGRELSREQTCFGTDGELGSWLAEAVGATSNLLTFPGQSNMNGRRLPLSWCGRARSLRAYTLLDAAALASTSRLDLSDPATSPDFTALSLYKIFGFPDLGALIVRKAAAPALEKRRYFGGGTVDMVVCGKEQWHARKSGPLHQRLEDGTVPFHSISALGAAIDTHEELFGSMRMIGTHTLALARDLHTRLTALRHGNGEAVCHSHTQPCQTYEDSVGQGSIVAFNLRDCKGVWVSNTEVERLAAIKNIHIRTGGVCNPGGIAQALSLSPWEMRENFSAGHRCGGEDDVISGKPTGVIRTSLGAMSTISDVARFVAFVDEFFVDKRPAAPTLSLMAAATNRSQRFHVESLTVYPIKSCAGWMIPSETVWEIRKEGLAWDREWCVVHKATGKALSQKQYPRMALIRPTLDFKAGLLRIGAPCSAEKVEVPLSKDPRSFGAISATQETDVCNEAIQTQVYVSEEIASFFTRTLGVSCTLARFPAANGSAASARHSKAHLQTANSSVSQLQPILLSNESPILTISRSSLNRLNEQIKAKGGKAAHLSVFRANIVLAESPSLPPGQEQPWAEDEWDSMRIGGEDGPVLDFLAGCRRCQMVCIDQVSGEKNQEPFITLAKTRRRGGRVLFGVHTALRSGTTRTAMVKTGDTVETFCDDYIDA